MGATSDWARRALLVLNNQFVDHISAVHATTSHIARRLTGSAPIHEVFSHQVPSASDAHMSLPDHALFVIGGGFHSLFVTYLRELKPGLHFRKRLFHFFSRGTYTTLASGTWKLNFLNVMGDSSNDVHRMIQRPYLTKSP